MALGAPMFCRPSRNHEQSVPTEPLAHEGRCPTRDGVPVRALAHRRVCASISSISWTDAIQRCCKQLTSLWPPLLSRDLSSAARAVARSLSTGDRSRDAAWRHDRSAWNAIVRPPQPGRPLSPFRRRASRESKGDEARARVGRDRRRSGRSPPPNTEGDGGPRSADDPRARRWTLHRYHPGPGRHRVRPAYRRLTGLAHRSPTVLPAPAAEWSPSATAPACSSANGSPPAVSRPDAG